MEDKVIGKIELPVPDKMLGLADILAADTIEYKLIPGFKPGEVFRIRSVTAGDFIEWQEAGEGEAKRTAGLRLIVKSLVDADGKYILDDSSIQILKKLAVKTTEAILKEIVKLNDIGLKGKEKND